MKYKFSYIFYSLVFITVGLSSCDENKFDVDITDHHVQADWLRLESDFTGLATKPSFTNYNDSLQNVYGSFYRLYAGRIMNFGSVTAPVFEDRVMRFLLHKDIHQLYRTVDSTYHDLSLIHI